MRGIILAGGHGTRLWPATAAVSKQLLPLAGRPLVWFPLVTLMEVGIREICVITMPHETERFIRCMADGSQWGLEIQYRKQPEPKGIAEAFLIAEDFIQTHESIVLILGDNLFLGLNGAVPHAFYGSIIFVTEVAQPERYGVVRLSKRGAPMSIKEKPARPSSYDVVTGLYLCRPDVAGIVKNLTPSKRGELEITDVLSEFIARGQLTAIRLPPAAVWMDCGTASDLHEASALVMAMEKRTGAVLGSPEVTAFRQGFIGRAQFDALVSAAPECEYRQKLKDYAQKNIQVL